MRSQNIFISGVDGSLGRTLWDRAHREGMNVFGTSAGLFSRDVAAHYLSSTPPHLDYVILNDGTNKLSRIGELHAKDVHEIIGVNLMMPMFLLDAIVAQKKGPCRVLFIASQTYRVAQRTTSVYCASKAGLVQFAKVAARELAGEGYVINTLAPGKIGDTRMSELTDAQVVEQRGWTQEEAERYALGLIPAGRFTSTSEVADAAFKILQLPSYVNGTVIEMMGGV